MIKPFLNQVTHDKISVYGFDKAEWTAALLQDIDADQLPAFYGGTMVDPDGNTKCPSKVNAQLSIPIFNTSSISNWNTQQFSMGGSVPDSYFTALIKPTPKSYMTSLTIPSGSKKKLEYKIIAANSLLR